MLRIDRRQEVSVAVFRDYVDCPPVRIITRTGAAMIRERGADKSRRVADPSIRAAIALSGGDCALARIEA